MLDRIKRALQMCTPALAEGEKLGDLIEALQQKIVGTPTASVGEEDADAIAVTFQLKDLNGDNLAEKRLVRWYLSDAAAAGAVSADAPSGGTAVTTGRALGESTAELSGEALTDANGTLVLTLTEEGADTWYATFICDGVAVTSAAITHAA